MGDDAEKLSTADTAMQSRVHAQGSTHHQEAGELGARAHNYLLLTLARRRKHEEKSGVDPSEAGWVYVDDLMKELRLERSALNVQVWHACQAFMKEGLSDDELFERRASSAQ